MGCLFKGDALETLKDVAPWLVALKNDVTFIRDLFTKGIVLWADHGAYIFVPLLTGLWWVLFAPKSMFRAGDMLVWFAR